MSKYSSAIIAFFQFPFKFFWAKLIHDVHCITFDSYILLHIMKLWHLFQKYWYALMSKLDNSGSRPLWGPPISNNEEHGYVLYVIIISS